MKFNPSHAVVDADIARACGISEHPVSKSSRDVLVGIREFNLGVAFCPMLLNEWKKHRSLYATKWLASMVAKKKFHLIATAELCLYEVENAGLTEVQKQIALKDAHVIDAALSTGNFIASNDKTAREVFAIIASGSPLLKELIWVVPTEDADELMSVFINRGYTPKSWLINSN